jgi:transcriptional regulator with XRE-family HTH domain
MNLGLIIRQLRERREWTQDALARRVGTTAANISRVESGKHSPGAELLGSIAYELMAMAEGFQPPELVARFDADEETLVRQFRRMGKEEKELFKAVAAAFAKVKPQVAAHSAFLSSGISRAKCLPDLMCRSEKRGRRK